MILREQNEINSCLTRLLNNSSSIALDTETKPFSKERVTIQQLGLEGIGLYYDTKEYCYIVYNDSLDLTLLSRLIYRKIIICHNAKFDLQVLLFKNIITSRNMFSIKIVDTMLMSYMLDENRPCGLKYLTEIIFNVKPTQFNQVGDKPTPKDSLLEEYKEELKTWEDKMGSYCIEDCVNTYNLYEYFLDQFKGEAQAYKIYTELEIPFMFVLVDMEYRGIKLDIPKLNMYGDNLGKIIPKLEHKIYSIAGEEFDINSPKQLGNIYKKLGTELPKTEKGNYSSKAEVLRDLVQKGDKFSEEIMKYREYSKLLSTYILALPKMSVDSTIHCSFNQTGTKTSRLSSSKPNLQNIPRRDDEFNIRECFIPREGHKFIICDYSQMELRILAHYSQDKALLDTYANDGDIHAATAEAVGCDRITAKTINFGIAYGRTAVGISHGLGIPKKEGQDIINTYFNTFKGIKKYIDKMSNMVVNSGFVSTIIGRKRRFPKYNSLPLDKDEKMSHIDPDRMNQLEYERRRNNSSDRRKGVNFPIQGSASDIVKIAMRDMLDKLYKFDSHILIQIHDEVVVEAPEEYAGTVMMLVKNSMENAVKFKGIPLKAEPKITSVWEK